jgi:hypothetical protein
MLIIIAIRQAEFNIVFGIMFFERKINWWVQTVVASVGGFYDDY